MQIVIDHLKCDGCANTIRKRVGELAGVANVEVDRDAATVHLDADEALRPQVVEMLAKLGYPERGSGES